MDGSIHHARVADFIIRHRQPPELSRKIERAVENWKHFFALPEEVKRRFRYSGDEKISGAGYELKKGENGHDLKETMHIRRDQYSFLFDQVRAVGSNEARYLVEAGLTLLDELDAFVLLFAKEVEEVCNLAGFAAKIHAARHFNIFRLLHYLGERSSGDEFAAPHCDKGDFTGTLYQDGPGVEMLSTDGTWIPMDAEEKESLFFAGLRLQYHTKGQLLAPCHRVIATSQMAQYGRVSAVCFSNMQEGPFFDKERLGRTQNIAPGSTYDMPFEEFATFFQ